MCFYHTRKECYEKFSQISPGFNELTVDQKFLRLMCPISPQETKIVNRYINNMFEKRSKIDAGENLNGL